MWRSSGFFNNLPACIQLISPIHTKVHCFLVEPESTSSKPLFCRGFYIIIYLFSVIQYLTNKTFCSAIINKNTRGHIYIYWGHKRSLYLNVVRNWVIISSYKGLVLGVIFHEVNCYFSVTWRTVACLRFKSAFLQIYPCLKQNVKDM